MTGTFDFSMALEKLKGGEKVCRKGWGVKGIYIFLRPASDGLDNCLCMDTSGLKTDNPFFPKSVVPWFVSQTDLLKEDWCVYEESEAV